MLTAQPFYNKCMKKAIIAFGSLFSNIKITRSNEDGSETQTLKIPIAQAPKEKWLVRVDSDPNLENHTYTSLPRMSFEISNISYDSSRKLNKLNKIRCTDGSGSADFVYAPVPYNLDMTLYILTKTQEDAFQIVEQILPYFSPEFTIGVKMIDSPPVVTDIPIVLNSVSMQDDYDGDFQTRRFVTYTLTFTMKLNLFGPTGEKGVIKKTMIDIQTPEDFDVEPIEAIRVINEGDPTNGNVVETIEFTYGESSE